MPSCWEFRSIARGVIRLSQKRVACIFRCLPISIPKARSLGDMERIGIAKGCVASVLYFVLDRDGVVFWSYRSPIAVRSWSRRHSRCPRKAFQPKEQPCPAA